MITQLRLHAVVFETIFSCVTCGKGLRLTWTKKSYRPLTLHCPSCGTSEEVIASLEVLPKNKATDINANAPARAKEGP